MVRKVTKKYPPELFEKSTEYLEALFAYRFILAGCFDVIFAILTVTFGRTIVITSSLPTSNNNIVIARCNTPRGCDPEHLPASLEFT